MKDMIAKPLRLMVALLPIVMVTPAAANELGAWLSLKRSEVVRLLVGEAYVESVKFQTLDEMLDTLRSAPAPNARDIRELEAKKIEVAGVLSSDETVWLVSNLNIPVWLAMAGRGDNIHSVKIGVPVVNYSQNESERVFAALSALFKGLFPAWPDAGEWPTKSLDEAWKASPLVRKEFLSDLNDVIIRKRLDGVTTATFGVPPDVVVYTITARDRCVPDMKKGNPFARLIC